MKGKSLTASSHAVVLTPDADSDVWARLEGGRRGAGRPPPHARVRRRRVDRPGREPVRARPHARRLERRLGRGAGGGDGPAGHRHRHGGLAAHPVRAVGHVHDQADARRAAAARRLPAQREPRPPRADGAHARRLRDRRWRRSSGAGARRGRPRCAARASRRRRGSRWSSRAGRARRLRAARSTPAARPARSSSSHRRRPPSSSSAATSSTC